MPLSPEERAELAAIRAERARRAGAAPEGAQDVSGSVSFTPAAPASGGGVGAPPADQSSVLAAVSAAEKGSEPARAAGEEGVERYEQLPDWMRMPELRSLSKNAALALVGTLATGPEETKKIIETQFPKIGARQDGRYIIFKSEDGNEYAWKPGLRFSDVARGLAAAGMGAGATAAGAAMFPAVAAAVPAGVGGAMLGGAASGLVGGVVNEAAQAAAGGRFDPGDAALSGVVGGAIPAVGGALRGAKGLISGAPDVPPMQSFDDLAAAAGRASQGGADDAARLAASVAPDQEMLAAAERQGLTPNLLPEQITTNPAARDVFASARSSSSTGLRSEAEKTAERLLGQVRDKLSEFGAKIDRGVFDESLRDGVAKSYAAASKSAKEAYDDLFKTIGRGTEVDATPTLEWIAKYEADLGGAPLPKMLKAAKARLTERPTLLNFDSFRKQVGAATKGKGAFGKEEAGLASGLKAAMEENLDLIADKFSQGDKLKAAKALKIAEGDIERGFEGMFKKQFDKTLEGSALGRTSGAVDAAARGDTSKLIGMLKIVPEPQRQEFLMSTFGFALEKAGDFSKMLKVFDALDVNPQLNTMMKTSVTPEARAGLRDVVTVLRGVNAAAGVSGDPSRLKAALPKLKAADGFVSRLYGLFKAKTGGIGQVAADLVQGESADEMRLIGRFLADENGALIRGVTSGKPPKPGLIKGVLRSLSFKRMMDAANVPPSERQRWLEKVINSTTQQQGGETTIEEK